ncbi:c-type cytochrome [Cupriavidus sp. RAF12]|uniref:c-type cytochrome n=1 Tax=Cupriavidus sp. RAF12 TaxID=3233050 RepID=UPI003F901F67
MRSAMGIGGARWLLALALTAACLPAAAEVTPTPASPAVEQGRAMFYGEAALAAHLRGEARALPAGASRCANCHVVTRGTESFGPRLTADSLLGLSARRGGPPTAYDRNTFCSVMADSVDVAGVMLARSMPQYRLSDQECTALWSYLLTQ